MGYKCFVDTCRSESNLPNIRLHSFPKDVTLCEKWVAALNEDYSFWPKKSHRICNKHFEDHFLVLSSFGNIKLKSDAIPSIFTNAQCSLFQDHLQSTISEIIPSTSFSPVNSEEIEHVDCNVDVEFVNDNNVENSPALTTPLNFSKKIRTLFKYSGDFTEQDLETPCMFWNTYKVMRQKNKMRVRRLEQKDGVYN